MNLFDFCIITASNSKQAEVFRTLIRRRIEAGLYPREIDFSVYHDPDAGRVGSGGGTLLALLNALREAGSVRDPASFFSSHRILIIHAGGESRRMPCYAPEGKLFAPLPLASSSIFPPVVLDVHITFFLKYPWRRGEVVVISGDAVFDFDASCVPEQRAEMCGFAVLASFEQGARHGVFRFDAEQRKVLDYYQKADVDFLRSHAAIEGTAECALDMGIVALGPTAAAAFVECGLHQRWATAVARGEVSFDLYLEILTASLAGINLGMYMRRMRSRSSLDEKMLEAVYALFRQFPLHGLIGRGAIFIHVGELGEYNASCTALRSRGIRPFYAHENEEIDAAYGGGLLLVNCVDFTIPAGQHAAIYGECCRSAKISRALGNNVFVGLDHWSFDTVIPEGICIEERRLRGGAVVRLVYGVRDSFRPQDRLEDVSFCGTPMPDWLRTHGLAVSDLWEGVQPPYDLLTARLFVENPDECFMAAYWQQPFSDRWSGEFRRRRRYSVSEVNTLTSALQRDERRIALRSTLLRCQLAHGIGWRNIPLRDFVLVVGADRVLRDRLCRLQAATDDAVLRAYRSRCITALCQRGSFAPPPAVEINYVRTREPGALSCAVKNDQIVWARAPVRLDLAGGWSDTPPYTLSFGGQVTNLAVDLNGQPPIQVFCRRTSEPNIRLHSIDLGVGETLTRIEQLADYRDPASAFGLPKAALSLLLGLNCKRRCRKTLRALLDDIGCGLELTLLCAVPKGSGLGTSSILGATILGALHRFFGLSVSREELFRQVLQMEQMLTTGGGWQDQIGGVMGGVKYIESKPGLLPCPVIHTLDPWLFEADESHRCFTLFYTGMTRLAKNILSEVVAQVNGRTPAYLFTLEHVRSLALEAREAIGLRDLKRLAAVVNASWRANCLIHPSSTNRQVAAMLKATRPYYSGVKLLGAGGGGYALFVSADNTTAQRLREVLCRRFERGNARLVDFSLNHVGLQVTVS